MNKLARHRPNKQLAIVDVILFNKKLVWLTTSENYMVCKKGVSNLLTKNDTLAHIISTINSKQAQTYVVIAMSQCQKEEQELHQQKLLELNQSGIPDKINGIKQQCVKQNSDSNSKMYSIKIKYSLQLKTYEFETLKYSQGHEDKMKPMTEKHGKHIMEGMQEWVEFLSYLCNKFYNAFVQNMVLCFTEENTDNTPLSVKLCGIPQMSLILDPKKEQVNVQYIKRIDQVEDNIQMHLTSLGILSNSIEITRDSWSRQKQQLNLNDKGPKTKYSFRTKQENLNVMAKERETITSPIANYKLWTECEGKLNQAKGALSTDTISSDERRPMTTTTVKSISSSKKDLKQLSPSSRDNSPNNKLNQLKGKNQVTKQTNEDVLKQVDSQKKLCIDNGINPSELYEDITKINQKLIKSNDNKQNNNPDSEDKKAVMNARKFVQQKSKRVLQTSQSERQTFLGPGYSAKLENHEQNKFLAELKDMDSASNTLRSTGQNKIPSARGSRSNSRAASRQGVRPELPSDKNLLRVLSQRHITDKIIPRNFSPDKVRPIRKKNKIKATCNNEYGLDQDNSNRNNTNRELDMKDKSLVNPIVWKNKKNQKSKNNLRGPTNASNTRAEQIQEENMCRLQTKSQDKDSKDVETFSLWHRLSPNSQQNSDKKTKRKESPLPKQLEGSKPFIDEVKPIRGIIKNNNEQQKLQEQKDKKTNDKARNSHVGESLMYVDLKLPQNEKQWKQKQKLTSKSDKKPQVTRLEDKIMKRQFSVTDIRNENVSKFNLEKSLKTIQKSNRGESHDKFLKNIVNEIEPSSIQMIVEPGAQLTEQKICLQNQRYTGRPGNYNQGVEKEIVQERQMSPRKITISSQISPITSPNQTRPNTSKFGSRPGSTGKMGEGVIRFQTNIGDNDSCNLSPISVVNTRNPTSEDIKTVKIIQPQFKSKNKLVQNNNYN